ncbi:PHD-zinc-finger like domain-containing protein [Gamsiella multidivaricata]|uniref:PHD-zinc-finger like domain-containing protein n=1 Tax=Gamsiella multidivaricata TaxID=101098 RepID=UPI00221FF782|nr:PHD-zinc-finger like domain-containing protein [Gamsiella multidivaricata]KAI7819272.1 PHD-zinc-finger like domain-containing protein [Gamsiella multidivaricata]
MSSNGSSPQSTPDETDCLICGSGKSFIKNQILFCDGPGCDIPVHQNCYGVAVVPEGNWYCQRCEDRIPVSNTPCCCCPQRTGAFKRTTVPNQYIHVACARFHPSLDETFDPIAFSPWLANKQTCSICKSDYGLCSECSVESCTRAMHVTCAQKEGLVTKGKGSQLFCDLHKDIGALSRIMKRQGTKDSQSATPPSSGSTFRRSTKRSKSYRESSSDDEDEDEEDEYASESDEEVVDLVADDESQERRRRTKSAPSSSASSTSGSKGHSRTKRSLDATDRRTKERSSDSEEIDVDDTEAVLGSSLGNNGTSSAHRKKIRAVETVAESQRRRLLMTLDKNKKKQGVTPFSGVTNLSSVPIRTLGGVGLTGPSSILGGGSSGEARQKLPGVSRYGYNSSNNDLPSSNPYASPNSMSPSAGSTERFSGNGSNQGQGRGPSDGSGRNSKGLIFDLDPAIDVSIFKTSNSAKGSTAPSPINPNFSTSGSPVHARLTDKQQQSPRSGSGISSEEVKEMQATIQALTQHNQQLQQQLASVSNSSATPPSGSSSAVHTTASSGLSAPGQDLQRKFDSLQHAHGQEKMRNLTLRRNLRALFGFLQVPVVLPGVDHTQSVQEFSAEKLDEYVQALRDAVVGPDAPTSSGMPSRPTVDAKRRNMVVDRVLKEMDF